MPKRAHSLPGASTDGLKKTSRPVLVLATIEWWEMGRSHRVAPLWLGSEAQDGQAGA
jgi:hypothetical protein